ncbi:hypothetical protein [Azospirillum sp. B510]|uniref:hypothetical protein n=1 Tax=Azospirillum sp. (strain B510) TaxID=137722 RepID=UPI00030EF8DC|nr:hypothetical protein [Azospirillum sp. B510]
MPHRQDSATVSVIRQIRDHSRACHNLPAREILLRVERRMIQFLENGMAWPICGPGADQDRTSQSGRTRMPEWMPEWVPECDSVTDHGPARV